MTTPDDLVPRLTRFLRPGGRLGIATPALTREVHGLGAVPPHIERSIGGEAAPWHTAEW
ncbi:hypothetical protein ACFQ6U_04880 [Streptomyces sp. NPDC056465]|uniref:hypothetical protein n=1 Tax=unclassified Streptomyces TaxID=2593676 RepID=UPI0035E27128